jgi:drug/metabolite transporter (DMT)-like permease
MNLPLSPPPRSATWSVALAFAVLYTTWGTTYLAIKVGVEVLPPALFGGVRIGLAGLILLGYLALRGERLRLPRRELLGAAGIGICLFVGGNGLITFGEKTVPSGAASVLVATTPLWLALLETVWPWGERLRLLGWVGLLLGLAGVCVLLAPRLRHPEELLNDTGPLLVIGSSMCWGVGSFLVRHQRRTASALTTAAYQMVLGGGALTLLGLGLGEVQQLRPEMLWGKGMVAFFYLLFVGSLLGFVTYTWLLERVSAVLVSTYAYVNPGVALLVGWLLGGEAITGGIIGGMVVILAGVALVRTAGTVRPPGATEAQEPVRVGVIRKSLADTLVSPRTGPR